MGFVEALQTKETSFAFVISEYFLEQAKIYSKSIRDLDWIQESLGSKTLMGFIIKKYVKISGLYRSSTVAILLDKQQIRS